MHCPKCKSELVKGILSDMLLTKHCQECAGEWIPGDNYQNWKASHSDIELNPGAGQLYFCDQQTGRIRRYNLDGTPAGGVTMVTDTTYQPYYLDLDLVNGKIYWGDFDGVSTNTGNVFRMNLDGSARETIVTGNLETRAVCADVPGGMLYRVNRNAGKIMRCKLSDFEWTQPTLHGVVFAILCGPCGVPPIARRRRA